MFIMLDDEKNKAVEKTGFRVWGVSQKVSLRRWFLSKVLSRCKTRRQGGERQREVKSKNSEKESFKNFFLIPIHLKNLKLGITYFIETFLKYYLFS